MMRKILCLHQGAELYGSDRSFHAAVSSLEGTDSIVDVILPVSGPLAEQFRSDGVSVSYYPRGILRKQRLRRPFSFAWELASATFYYLRVFKSYDVLYVNTVVMLAALIAAAPYAHVLHRTHIFCHVREIPSRRTAWMFRLVLRLSGARLLYNSAASQKALALPGKVIHNGVEDAKECGSVPRVHGINLLLVGRINSWKGQKFFLETLASLPTSVCQRIKARIVGSPYEGYEHLEAELLNFVKQHQLSDIVELFPFTPDPAKHFLWASYVIVPSTLPEPFGRVAVEAFSYGRPVIAARHGGLQEIVTHKRDGFLFEPCSVPDLAYLLDELPLTGASEYSLLSRAARGTYESRFSLARYQQSVRSQLLQ